MLVGSSQRRRWCYLVWVSAGGCYFLSGEDSNVRRRSLFIIVPILVVIFILLGEQVKEVVA